MGWPESGQARKPWARLSEKELLAGGGDTEQEETSLMGVTAACGHASYSVSYRENAQCPRGQAARVQRTGVAGGFTGLVLSPTKYSPASALRRACT